MISGKSVIVDILRNVFIGPSFFSFDYTSVNEYIITNVDYENWYSCDNCDYNKEQKFVTSNFTCGRIKFCL